MERKYCGKQNQLPPGYTRNGTRYECLQTGFGVATALCRQRAYQRMMPFAIVAMTLASVLLLFLLVDMFRRRSNAVSKEEDDDKVKTKN